MVCLGAPLKWGKPLIFGKDPNALLLKPSKLIRVEVDRNELYCGPERSTEHFDRANCRFGLVKEICVRSQYTTKRARRRG
jgi:hypothetical protein